jgi:hypothetical protein
MADSAKASPDCWTLAPRRRRCAVQRGRAARRCSGSCRSLPRPFRFGRVAPRFGATGTGSDGHRHRTRAGDRVRGELFTDPANGVTTLRERDGGRSSRSGRLGCASRLPSLRLRSRFQRRVSCQLTGRACHLPCLVSSTLVFPAGQDTTRAGNRVVKPRVDILRSSLTEIAVRAGVGCGGLKATDGERRRASGWPRE